MHRGTKWRDVVHVRVMTLNEVHFDATRPWSLPPPTPASDGAAQPILVDAPVVVLLAVDQRDGDLLGILRDEIGLLEHVDLLHLGARLGGDLLDDGARVVAQVAAGLGDEGDSSHSIIGGVSESASQRGDVHRISLGACPEHATGPCLSLIHI